MTQKVSLLSPINKPDIGNRNGHSKVNLIENPILKNHIGHDIYH